MIQFKRAAFLIAFTSLTPFPSAFAKSNSKKCSRSLKAASPYGSSSDRGHARKIETILIASNPIAADKMGNEITAPIVLYADGTACLDIKLVASDDERVSLHADLPEQSATWNYNADHQVELRSALPGLGGLPTIQNVSPLPFGFKLMHSYTARARKADAEQTGVRDFLNYRFLEDGTFFAGEAAESGRYTIDGYSMELAFDDGHVESRSLVADSEDSSVIWIDGETFVDER